MALFYAALFHSFGFATWWPGGLLGFAHAAFVLTVVLPCCRAPSQNGLGLPGP